MDHRLDTAGPIWDPLAKCSSRPQSEGAKYSQAIHLMAWQAVVAAIIELAYAYARLRDAGNDDSESFKAIKDSINRIEKRLDEIDSDLKTIIGLLTNLPELLRTAAEEVAFKNVIGQAQGWARQVKDFSDDDYIDQHNDELQLSLQFIDTMMAAAENLKGVAALMFTVPIITIWIAGSTALERSKYRRDSSYKIYSPWEKSILKDTEKDVTLFYQVVHNTNAKLSNIIPDFPAHETILSYFTEPYGNVFLKNMPGTIEHPSTGDLRITCPGQSGGERLQKYTRKAFPPSAEWVDENDQTARNAFGAYLERRREMTMFYSIYSDLMQTKSEILDSFVEPDGIWPPQEHRASLRPA